MRAEETPRISRPVERLDHRQFGVVLKEKREGGRVFAVIPQPEDADPLVADLNRTLPVDLQRVALRSLIWWVCDFNSEDYKQGTGWLSRQLLHLSPEARVALTERAKAALADLDRLEPEVERGRR